MRIAITGGSGFIGRALIRAHAARGDSIRALTRRAPAQDGGATWICGDLLDPHTDLRRLVDGADLLYHCAGELRDERRMAALHIDGARRLAQAAAGRIGRWVQLSSVGAYGPLRDGVATEATPEAPVGLYERTKAEADRVVAKEARAGQFEYVIVRPSIVYGAEMPNRSLFQMIAMIERRLFFFIGPNGAMVNYVHISGVVEALRLCAEKPVAAGETYILSDHAPLAEAAAAMAEALGVSLWRVRLPERGARWLARLAPLIPGFPLTTGRIDALTNRVVYDGGKIERTLGYRHPLSLPEGFRQLGRQWR